MPSIKNGHKLATPVLLTLCPTIAFSIFNHIAVCATVAEVRKRGKDFWNEFEFYLSDLLVGLVLDILLVGLMATPAVIGKHHAAHNATGMSQSEYILTQELVYPSHQTICIFFRNFLFWKLSTPLFTPWNKSTDKFAKQQLLPWLMFSVLASNDCQVA